MWHNIIVITILTTEKSCCSLYRIGRRACKYWGHESMSTKDWRKLKKGQNYGRSKWALEKEVKKSEPTISPRYTKCDSCIYTPFSIIIGSSDWSSSSHDCTWHQQFPSDWWNAGWYYNTTTSTRWSRGTIHSIEHNRLIYVFILIFYNSVNTIKPAIIQLLYTYTILVG